MRLTHVSASQLEEFRRCPRRWYEAYVLKNKMPPSASMEKGTLIHAELEHYMDTGEIRPSDYADFVKVGAPFLPVPKTPNIETEIEIRMPTVEGGPEWLGYIDLFDYSNDLVCILDHKTTSDFRYCKSPEELALNTQMISYAYWAMSRPDIKRDEVHVAHVYYRTRGKACARRADAFLKKEHVYAQWELILADVRLMMEWAAREPKKSDALPPNTASCGLYGGCPYRSLCGLDSQKVKGFFMKTTEGTSALLEKLKSGETVVGGGIVPPDAPSRVNDPVVASDVKQDNPTSKRGRGRPPKAAAEPETTAPAPASYEYVSPGHVATTLFVDCTPVKGDERPAMLEEWLHPIMDMVAEANGVADFRLIKYTSKAELAAAIRTQLHTLPPLVLVSSSAPASDIFLETAIPHVNRVIRALRG